MSPPGVATAEAEARLAPDGLLAWRTLRAAQWRHFAVLPLAALAVEGRSLARGGAEPLPAALLPAAPSAGALLAGVAAAALCLAFAYGINAVGDRHGDRDPAKNPLAGLVRLPAAVHAAVWACAAAALSVAALLGPVALGAVGLSLAAGLAYSVGPRLKARPLLGALGNGLIFTPLLAVAVRDPADVPGLSGLAITFFVLLLQNQLVHEVDDRAEDAARNRTTALVLGPRRALALAGAAGVAGALAGLALAPGSPAGWVGAAGMVLGGAVAARAQATPGARRRHRHLSMAVGAAMVAAALLAPVGG